MKAGSILIVVCSMATAACSTIGKSNTPVCDGKHRRPVNLHGSVLIPAATPTSSPSAPEPVVGAPVYPGCGH